MKKFERDVLLKSARLMRTAHANAERAITECIKAMIEPYGDDGVELPYHTPDCYSVVSEIRPMEFVEVSSIRCKDDALEMMLTGETKWRGLAFVDLGFLLDEVIHIVEMD